MASIHEGTPKVRVATSHRSAISVTLNLLDEVLCRFERWARGGASSGVLYKEENDLEEGQRREILGRISDIRGIVSCLGGSLDIEAKVVSASRSLWAETWILLEYLVDMGPERLKRYGVLEEGLEQYLDPKIRGIIEGLRGISEACRKDATAR